MTRLFILPLLLAFLAPVHAQSRLTKAARDLHAKHQDALAVVTAVATVKIRTKSGDIPDQPKTPQTLGTIISDSGVLMVCNSAIDLSVGMLGERVRKLGDSGEYEEVLVARTVFSRIQVNLADNSQYNATIISANKDLDIAFLQLDKRLLGKRKSPLPYVDISRRIREGDILVADEVIGLSRSTPIFGYIPSVIPGYVTAISKREQTFYITTSGTSQGIPIFDVDGRFVGLTVQKIINGRSSRILGTLSAGSVKTLADLAIATSS